MNKYDTDKINAIDIRDVAEKLGIEVKKHGNTYMARCLWHADSHPSMQVGSEKDGYNYCHCYVCGMSAGVIQLVEKYLETDFMRACEWIDSNFSGDLYTKEYHDYLVDTGNQREEQRKREKRDSSFNFAVE